MDDDQERRMDDNNNEDRSISTNMISSDSLERKTDKKWIQKTTYSEKGIVDESVSICHSDAPGCLQKVTSRSPQGHGHGHATHLLHTLIISLIN